MAKFEGTVAEHLADVFDFNSAGLMGAERATRNTPGGDREHGLFGQEQSDFVALLNDPATNTFEGDPITVSGCRTFFLV